MAINAKCTIVKSHMVTSGNNKFLEVFYTALGAQRCKLGHSVKHQELEYRAKGELDHSAKGAEKT